MKMIREQVKEYYDNSRTGQSFYNIRMDIEYMTVDDVIETVTELKSKYGEKYSKLYFELIDDCSCYHDCSCRPNAYLYGEREETKDEENIRLEIIKKNEELRLAQEKAKYEELRKKFENG